MGVPYEGLNSGGRPTQGAGENPGCAAAAIPLIAVASYGRSSFPAHGEAYRSNQLLAPVGFTQRASSSMCRLGHMSRQRAAIPDESPTERLARSVLMGLYATKRGLRPRSLTVR
jgi:hypothetical protein